MTLGSTQVPVSDWLDRYLIHISKRKFPKSTWISVSRDVFRLYYFPSVAATEDDSGRVVLSFTGSQCRES